MRFHGDDDLGATRRFALAAGLTLAAWSALAAAPARAALAAAPARAALAAGPARAALAAGPARAAPPLAGDGVRGVWRTQDGEAHIRIEECGADELCGRVVWLRDPLDERGEIWLDEHNPDPGLRDRRVLGMTILYGLDRRADDDGIHRHGRIYDPDTGHTWSCRIEMDDDGRLKMRGYLGLSLFGRSVHWTRVLDEAAAAEGAE